MHKLQRQLLGLDQVRGSCLGIITCYYSASQIVFNENYLHLMNTHFIIDNSYYLQMD